MKEETVRQMELTRRDANTMYQHLCDVALDIADVVLHAKEGNTQADMDWQNEFDRQERIVS